MLNFLKIMPRFIFKSPEGKKYESIAKDSYSAYRDILRQNPGINRWTLRLDKIQLSGL